MSKKRWIFLKVPWSTKTIQEAIDVRGIIDDDIVKDIIDVSRETGVRWRNPADTMWMLNYFAKTSEWQPFKKKIYNLKTRFTVSALKNSWKKMRERKWLFKFKRWDEGEIRSMHPRSWMKKLKKEWLLE